MDANILPLSQEQVRQLADRIARSNERWFAYAVRSLSVTNGIGLLAVVTFMVTRQTGLSVLVITTCSALCYIASSVSVARTIAAERFRLMLSSELCNQVLRAGGSGQFPVGIIEGPRDTRTLRDPFVSSAVQRAQMSSNRRLARTFKLWVMAVAMFVAAVVLEVSGTIDLF